MRDSNTKSETRGRGRPSKTLKSNSYTTVTMQDVANRAGVSFQTVSRALNNPDIVSQATRDKIDKVIAELNYVPNSFARQLAKAEQVNIVGVVTLGNKPYNMQNTINYSQQIAKDNNYSVVLRVVYDYSYEILHKAVEELKSQLISRILIDVPLSNDKAQQLVKNFPDCRIIFLAVEPYSAVLNVSFNPFDSTLASIRYLKSLGHTNVVLLKGPKDDLLCSLQEQAWNLGLSNENMKILAQVNSNYSVNNGYEAMSYILNEYNANNFSVVICANDDLAMGAIASITDRGLKVPEDISIIGYGDFVISQHCIPKLTTIKLDYYQQIKIAFEKLISQDQASSLISTELCIRKSCTQTNNKEQEYSQDVNIHHVINDLQNALNTLKKLENSKI